MQREIYERIAEKANSVDAREETIAYLAQHLGGFLRSGERVLICFLDYYEGSIGWLMEQAVLRCEAEPVVWGPDCRWKTLLRLAFANRITAIIGPPLVILGLSKICKYRQIPLYVRKVITAGYPCLDWMIEGIITGLDCEVGGCFSLDQTGVVAGFACGKSWGVHLRQNRYGVDILDESGNVLPDGEPGRIVLYPKDEPILRLETGDRAYKLTAKCRCGSPTPRLLGFYPTSLADPDLLELGQMLQSWTSILDCHVHKGECGLEMEIVYFQGEKLPKLPNAAKLILRPWNPETDEPFPYDPTFGFTQEKC